MTEENNTPPQKTSAAIANLKEALADPFIISGHDPAILAQQTELLDRLFTAILDDKVSVAFSGERYYGDGVKEWLAFALKLQKQCNETVKSKAAIDYMQALSTPPHPLKIQKQKEGS